MIPAQVKEFIIQNFKNDGIVCLTGAGISVDSGIPPFRGSGGLWSDYDPQLFGTKEGLRQVFYSNPEVFAEFISKFYILLLKARPNPGHMVLAELEKRYLLSALITQNIDSLHFQAGNRNCVELHGNAFRIRCANCNQKIMLEKDRLKEMIRLLELTGCSRIGMLKIFSRYFPRCNCGARFRADIVLFGEPLPEQELSLAYRYIQNCSLLLILGTSLSVYPAAELPFYAKECGAKLMEINREATPLSKVCDCSLRSGTTEALLEIRELLGYA